MRGECLIKGHELINGARQDRYGDPEDSFARIAEYWTAYLKYYDGCALELKPKDVAIMMMLFKLARTEISNDPDSWQDGAGYWGLAADLDRSQSIDEFHRRWEGGGTPSYFDVPRPGEGGE